MCTIQTPLTLGELFEIYQMMKNCLKLQKQLVIFLPLKASVHSTLTFFFFLSKKITRL